MFLVGHTIVAATIVQAAGINNPVAAFGIGWLSHYLVDFFPHGDEPVGLWAKQGNELKRIAVIFGIDAAILLGLFIAYIVLDGFSLSLFLAGLGAVVPDVMWGLEMLFKKKLFGPHDKIHSRNHNFLHIHLPYHLALVGQLVVSAVLWWRFF